MAGQRKSFFVYDMVGGKITRVHGIRGTNFTALRRSCFYTHQKTCRLFLPILGRDERFFDKFVVSPDNKLLVFLGKDGYMPLVSNKVKPHSHFQHH